MRSARAWLRWRLAQALGRNPLVRVSDRLLLAAVALAVAVSIGMIPVACAFGGTVTEAQAETTRAELGQAQAAASNSRVSALAVIGTEGVAISDDYPRVSTSSQQARLDGTFAGMTVWVLVGSCAVALVALARRCIARRQEASWDWDAAALLVGDDETDRLKPPE
jgi:hypothetical protein